MRSNNNSVLVRIANAAIPPPKPKEPVSPMNISAGKALYHNRPMHAPPTAAQNIAKSRRFCLKAMPAYAIMTIVTVPAASPSRPSVRFTPFVADATITKRKI